MINIETKSSFKQLEKLAKRVETGRIERLLARFGQEGVNALEAATPVDSGITAGSWFYEVKVDGKSASVIWGNSNRVGDQPLAIMIQYGHGTGTGGYVQGQDYINPALRPIFDRIAAEIRKEVKV